MGWEVEVTDEFDVWYSGLSTELRKEGLL